jgi:hypothetical protein
MALGAHRHRKAGRPMKYGGAGHLATTTADVEQHAPVAPETTQYAAAPADPPVQSHPTTAHPQYTGV